MKSKNIIVNVIFCAISLQALDDGHVLKRHSAISSAAVGLTMGTATAAFSNFLSGAPDASGIIAMGCSAFTQSCFLGYQLKVLRDLDDHDVRIDYVTEVIQSLHQKTIISAALLGALTPIIYRKYEGDDVTLYDLVAPALVVGIIGAKKTAEYVNNRLSYYLEHNK